MIRSIYSARAWFLGILATLGTLPAAFAQEAEWRWGFEEPNATVPQTVALGNQGSLVFSTADGFTSTAGRLLSSHSPDPASVVWQTPPAGEARQARVASAEQGDVHAVLHLAHAPEGPRPYRPRVQAFRTGSSTPSLVWSSSHTVFETTRSGVHVSEDGTRIVAAFHVSSLGKTQVVVFAHPSPTPVLDLLVDNFEGFYYSALSRDASRLYLGGDARSYVVDLSGQGAVTTITHWVSGLRSHATSEDLSRVATGDFNRVLVFNRLSNGSYTQSHSLIPGGLDSFCRRIAMSGDGRYVVAGFLLPGNVNIRVIVWDLSTGSKISDSTLSGGGIFNNDVTGLAMSADGTRFALGIYGDQLGLIPQLSLFETGTSQPYAQFQLSGSVMGMAMSADGEWVAVARKSTHASVGASGGAIEFFATRNRDVRFVGIPRISGSSMRVEVRSKPGSPALALWNSYRENPPKTFSIGTLFVGRQGIGRFPLSPQGNGYDSAEWDFSLVGAPAVGQTYYFQGLWLLPTRLTEDHVAVTILP